MRGGSGRRAFAPSTERRNTALTALDPLRSEDRERLGLGLKAYRIISPSLPR